MPLLLTLLLVLTAAVPSVAQPPLRARDVLLIVDDLQAESRTTPQIRQLSARLIRAVTVSGGRVAIATTAAEGSLTSLTGEEEELTAAIARITGEGTQPSDVLDAGGQPRDEAQRRASLAISRAAAAVTAFASVARERGAAEVVFISPGYRRPPGVGSDALVEAALGAGVVVHAVDVRVVAGDSGPNSSAWRSHANASRAMLAGLAAQTRGIAVLGRPDLEELIVRLRGGK